MNHACELSLGFSSISRQQNVESIDQKFNPNSQNSNSISNNSSTTNDFRLNRTYTAGIQDLNYGYDNKGNILSISEAVENYYQSLSYDDLDRLTSSSEAGRYSQSFGYDSISNIIRVTDNSNIRDYSYSAHKVTS